MFDLQLMERYFKIVIISENIIVLLVIRCWTIRTSWPPGFLCDEALSRVTSKAKNILRHRSEFLLFLAN